MKNNPVSGNRGVALVLVLAFLVLISVFVIGFFLSASNELSQSSGYAATVTTQQLADTATNIVEGQIRESSTRPGEVWASQPGMIRTFLTNTPASYYKLYSSNRMVIEGANDPDGGKYDPYHDKYDYKVGSDGWNHHPALFVNLNDPVRVPIVEKTGTTSGTGAGVSGELGKDYEYRYPILDPTPFNLISNATDSGTTPKNMTVTLPDGTTKTMVEGAELILDTRDDSNNDPSGADKQTQYTRMPVRWLYVLKDGTVTAPSSDSSDGKTAIWDSGGTLPAGSLPSLTNPIVGRVAFWTDDDTCKVNINTAAGYTPYKSGRTEENFAGSYWDTPRFYTLFDMGRVDVASGATQTAQMSLAIAQPVRNEFQRYPGHPSTTSLGLLFKDFLTSEQIYKITPRINGGGSLGGTVRNLAQMGASPLDKKSERLYASVDELVYADSTTSDPLTSPRPRTDAKLGNSGKTLDTQLISNLRLFLTAHSRAPELNVFGRPRVTIWPLWPMYDKQNHAIASSYAWNQKSGTFSGQSFDRTYFKKLVNSNASEKLIAFCSTLGPKDGSAASDPYVRPYFFQRSNPYSPTEDASIQRNKDLFSYLARQMGQKIPGAGGASTTGTTVTLGSSFSDKFPGDSLDPAQKSDKPGDYRQIIAEIFDYIRCVNMRDATHDKPFITKDPTAPGPTPAPTIASQYKYAPKSVVVPSVVTIPGVSTSGSGTFTGFGRFPTVSQASLVFYHTGYVLKNYDAATKAKQPYIQLGGQQANRKQERELVAANPDALVGSFMAAFVVFEMFNPMEGYAGQERFDSGQTGDSFSASVVGRGLYFEEDVSGLDSFQVKAAHTNGFVPLQIDKGTGASGPLVNRWYYAPGDVWGGRYLGGTEGFFHTLVRATAPTASFPDTIADPYWYPFQSRLAFNHPMKDAGGNPIVVAPSNVTLPQPGVFILATDKTFSFNGGTATFVLKFAGTPVNTLTFNFPASSTDWPVPTDNIWNDQGGFWNETSSAVAGQPARLGPGYNAASPGYQFELWSRIFWARGDKGGSNAPWDDKTGGDGNNYASRYMQLIQPGDTIRSLVLTNPYAIQNETTLGMGDPRAAALMGNSSPAQKDYFKPHPDYQTPIRHAQNLKSGDGALYIGRISRDNETAPGAKFNNGTQPNDWTKSTRFGNMIAGVSYASGSVSTDVPYNVTAVHRDDGRAADFDTGLANLPDGGFLNKADEGTGQWRWWEKPGRGWVYILPYYDGSHIEAGYETYFSPNRQMPSAVQFGSLLAGRTKHWQTLAFSPGTAGPLHPGITKDPKDHYILDLFTMPVVEPYAISEPFSTAGKINLNYAIAPFGHIKRSTALRAALHPLRVVAVPNQESLRFKQNSTTATPVSDTTYRYLVDRDETLKAFDDHFNGGSVGYPEIFRTGSQICEMFLYPSFTNQNTSKEVGGQQMASGNYGIPFRKGGETPIHTFWENCSLTGDNLREKPYNDLYARITTKSNTFTVHMWVQALRKRSSAAVSPTDAANAALKWEEGKDQVLAEYRGSSTIERYLDPEDRRFNKNDPITQIKKDYLDPDTQSLENLYRWRVVESKRFAP